MFVDKDGGAARAIAENLRRTKLEAGGRVSKREALAWLADAATGPDRWDVVLVDPPYADTDALVRVLEHVGAVVRPGGIVVAKHFWRDAPPAAIGLLASERERRFGETALTFYRRTGGQAEQEAVEA
jgi:16S rRNA G966 N2-methylase RsmD